MVAWINIRKHIIGRDHRKLFQFRGQSQYINMSLHNYPCHVTSSIMELPCCSRDKFCSYTIISMRSKESYKAAMAAMDKLYGHDNKQFAVFEQHSVDQQQSTISNNRLQVQQAFNILVYILITTSCEYLIAYLN